MEYKGYWYVSAPPPLPSGAVAKFFFYGGRPLYLKKKIYCKNKCLELEGNISGYRGGGAQNPPPPYGTFVTLPLGKSK